MKKSVQLGNEDALDMKQPLSKNAVPLASTSSKSINSAFIALSIALIVLSAWVTLPLGPIPFTLQMLAIPFMIQVLTPKQAMYALAGYLLLGIIGVPVFSGMRGGIGILFGPTGGYLLGYIPGVLFGSLLLQFMRKHSCNAFLSGLVAAFVFTACAYVGGWALYMAIAQVDALQSFMVTVAPFVGLDCIKAVIATIAAQGVIKALPRHE